MIGYDDIKLIESRIDACNNQLNELYSELKTLKSSHWSYNDDEKCLDHVSIAGGHGSWQSMKDNSVAKPFYMESNVGDGCMDFSMEDAKEIIKYLQEKIEYLES